MPVHLGEMFAFWVEANVRAEQVVTILRYSYCSSCSLSGGTWLRLVGLLFGGVCVGK